MIGIGVALLIITRSLTQMLTIIASLLITYLTSLQITRFLSELILRKDYLTWNTPFFALILIIALGVDYSIFLMTRYHDNILAGLKPLDSIREAAGTIGSVVISAAVILGGTFAALIPSGVTTLIQVALAMIIGLCLLIVILPITIPATVKLSDRGFYRKS
ncbi:MMPL family transporter [Ligilactobacillus salivarius]|uniref:MMPL family transporter n=1 Tax=Ligilactobacillus salivarius TaxID=1624 RepID=UPI00237D9218|nr:MMPL family transporter [Ligilactobacillus salivarius]MDE1524550.1 MMPL family transporter [Ligilactobacillus salivarius]